jgi:mannose/fructose/N-acetylgalactosamine-specific phosphotransferase system component IIC
METPPTWRSALNRAGIAAAVFAVLMATVLQRAIGVAVAFSAVMLLLYVPLTYYTDLWIHRRYLRKQAAAKAAPKAKAKP